MPPEEVTGDHESIPLEVQRVAHRYELAKSFVPVAWIASLWIPLRGALPIAEALAGEDTNVTVTVSISIAFTLALSAGVIALLRRSAEQRREIQRLRRRCTALENELDVAKRIESG